MNRIILLVCSLALIGCDSRQSQSTSIVGVGFALSAPREAVVQQLERMHARTLTNAPELLRAEYQMPGTKNLAQVELTFRDGRLAGVNYSQPRE